LDLIRNCFKKKGYEICVLGNLEFRVETRNKGHNIDVHVLFDEIFTTAEINRRKATLELFNNSKTGRAKVNCCPIDMQNNGISLDSALISVDNFIEFFSGKKFNISEDCFIAYLNHGFGSVRPEAGDARGCEVAVKISKASQLLLNAADDIENYKKDVIFCTDYFKDSPRAVFYCSDAHGLDSIGRKFSYVKALPNFAGLKQVLLDPKERVRFDSSSPEVKGGKPYFSKIEVSGTAFKNEKVSFSNINIPLNERMVAIVGGRGSGKSLLLNALHSVFEDEHAPVEPVRSNSSKPKNPKTRDANPQLVRLILNRGKDDEIVFDNKNKKVYPYLHISQGEIKEMSEFRDKLSDEIKKMLGIGDRVNDQIKNTVKEKAEDFIRKFKSYMDDYYFKNEKKEFSKRESFYQKEINAKRQTVEALSSKHLKDALVQISAIDEAIVKAEGLKKNLEDFYSKTGAADNFFKNKINSLKDEYGIRSLNAPVFDGLMSEISLKIVEVTAELVKLEADKKIQVGLIDTTVLDYSSVAAKIEILNSEIRSFDSLLRKVESDWHSVEMAYSEYISVLDKLKDLYRLAEKDIRDRFLELKAGKDGYTLEQKNIINLILEDIDVK